LSLSQEHATRKEVAYNLLDSMNRLPASQSMAYTRTPPLHHISSDGLTEAAAKKKKTKKNKTTTTTTKKKNKQEADLLDSKGGFKSLLWVPMGRDEQQMVHSTSYPEMSSHTLSQKPCDSFTGN